MSSTFLGNERRAQLPTPVSAGASEAEAVASGAGVDCRCKPLLLWACLIAVVHGAWRRLALGQSLSVSGYVGLPATQRGQKWARECTRSEKEEKPLMAWGILDEALRNRCLVRTRDGGRKCLAGVVASISVSVSSAMHDSRFTIHLEAAAERAGLRQLFPKLALLAAEAWWIESWRLLAVAGALLLRASCSLGQR